jgi:hypothetical protein
MVLVDYIGIFFYISEYFWQMTTSGPVVSLTDIYIMFSSMLPS